MKRIIKDDIPLFWTKYKKRNPHKRYDDLENTQDGKSVRQQLRNHMVQQQGYICGYCCKRIDEMSSHNEHIKPRGVYPQLSMDYDNMIASCNSDSCGMAKKQIYDERKFVSPLDGLCEEHFRYHTDGSIEGTTEQGIYTVNVLNLNSYSLRTARKSLFDECCRMCEYVGKEYIKSTYMDKQDNRYPRFVDMVGFFYERDYFDVLAGNE